MNSNRYIAIFENARAVIHAEKACRRAGIAVAVIPLPEKYSSECGMALLFEAKQESEFRTQIKQLSLEVNIEKYG